MVWQGPHQEAWKSRSTGSPELSAAVVAIKAMSRVAMVMPHGLLSRRTTRIPAHTRGRIRVGRDGPGAGMPSWSGPIDATGSARSAWPPRVAGAWTDRGPAPAVWTPAPGEEGDDSCGERHAG